MRFTDKTTIILLCYYVVLKTVKFMLVSNLTRKIATSPTLVVLHLKGSYLINEEILKGHKDEASLIDMLV